MTKKKKGVAKRKKVVHKKKRTKSKAKKRQYLNYKRRRKQVLMLAEFPYLTSKSIFLKPYFKK